MTRLIDLVEIPPPDWDAADIDRTDLPHNIGGTSSPEEVLTKEWRRGYRLRLRGHDPGFPDAKESPLSAIHHAGYRRADHDLDTRDVTLETPSLVDLSEERLEKLGSPRKEIVQYLRKQGYNPVLAGSHGVRRGDPQYEYVFRFTAITDTTLEQVTGGDSE